MVQRKQWKNPFEKFMKLCIKAEDNETLNDKALFELAKLEQQHDLPPNVLVAKAACIQLGSGTTTYTLDDAEAALKGALEIDEENVEALIEIGYFYNYVLDKPVIAKPYFQKALFLSRKQLSESIKGIAECISETSPKKALNFIKKASKDTLDSRIIKNSITEITRLMS